MPPDPGRGYREKKRQVELVGSVDAKRGLAEESVKRGFFAEAIELYESAMQGPLGDADPTLLKGLGRARMLSGDGAGAEALFVKLKAADPAAFDADAELDYARALASQGKNDEAVAQYEKVVSRYPGEEARARFGLLLENLGQQARAQALFAEILKSVKGAPGYYRSRQREWVSIAKSHLQAWVPHMPCAAAAADEQCAHGCHQRQPHQSGGMGVEPDIQPGGRRFGATKPPRLPMVLIVRIPPAAAAPP